MLGNTFGRVMILIRFLRKVHAMQLQVQQLVARNASRRRIVYLSEALTMKQGAKDLGDSHTDVAQAQNSSRAIVLD